MDLSQAELAPASFSPVYTGRLLSPLPGLGGPAWHLMSTLCQEVRGIRQDSVAQFPNSPAVAMGHDAPDRNLLDYLPQLVELLRAPFTIQQPVHVGILHQFEKCLPRTHLLEARRICLPGTAAKQIDESNRPSPVREFRARPIQRQKALFPRRRESGKRLRIPCQFGNRIRPQAD